MKILFNTGVFGKHGIERALTNILLELPRANNTFTLHQIYELDYKSPFLIELSDVVKHDCALPRTSFWGNLHMNRKKSIFHKFVDSVGLLEIHKLIAKNINQHHADIIVDYDLSLLRSAHLINAPKIGFFHFRPKRFRNGGTKKLHRIGERLKHYQKLVVLCDEMYKEACCVWPHLKDKLLVLPNPIDIDSLLKKSEFPIDFPVNLAPGEYFVSVARLTHEKNIHLLLNSFVNSRDLGCRWPLVILGDGEDKVDLLKLSKELGIEKDVYFLGYQDNPYPYIKNAGALVLSSREEGFGLVLLEAIFLGCATISLSCPTGPTDILQNGKLGMLLPFTEDDPNELGLAMFEMSTNSMLRQSYIKESKLLVEDFSSQKIVRKLMRLFLDLAN